MKFRFSIFFATVLLSAQAVQADPMAVVMVEQALQDCLNLEENQSTAGMQMCHGNTTEVAEKMMNFYYEITVQQLDLDSASSDEYVKRYAVETKARLVTSQDLWIKYRDANCSLAGVAMLGGSGEGIVISECYSSMTIARLKELMELL